MKFVLMHQNVPVLNNDGHTGNAMSLGLVYEEEHLPMGIWITLVPLEMPKPWSG